MAIFGSKKAPTTKAPVKKAPASVAVVATKKQHVVAGIKNVIRRPRLTEKAANLSSANVYTFEVTPNATKHDIAHAVQVLYKVSPTRVNVVNVIGKKVALKTRRGFGVKNNMRKAYVFLKKGDTIDFAA
jgi:large subunit ribosomal protein L23